MRIYDAGWRNFNRKIWIFCNRGEYTILLSEYIAVLPAASLRLLHCCNHNSTFLCSKGDGYFFRNNSFRPPSKGTPWTDCCLNSLHRSLTSQPTITEPLFTEVPVHTACIFTSSANIAIPIDINGSNVGRCGLTFRGVGIQFSRCFEAQNYLL